MTALPIPAGVVLCSLVFGQQAADQSKDLGSIEGRTTNVVSGDPVRKVKLTLFHTGQDGKSHAAASDAEGRFVFQDVEPGTYHIQAEKAGFLDESLGSPLTVAKGQHVKDIEYKLTPQGVITGKVLDDEGEPVRRSSVSAALQPVSGSRQRGISIVASEPANDLGEFRIANLTPGRYILSAIPGFGFMDQPEAKENERTEAFVATYYPSSLDAGGASAVTVAAGQEVTGANITLQKARVFRVEGKVAGASADIRISLYPRHARNGGFGMGGGFGWVKPDGSFTVFNVQAGAYFLTVNSHPSGVPQMVARMPVDVTDGNVTGLSVQPLEPVQISGTVRVEGQETIGLLSRAWLRSADEGPMPMHPTAIEADGTFKMPGLMPGRYYFSVAPLPYKMYLKSVRIKSQDVLESGLDLSDAQGTVQLDVVLGTKPGAVEGSVSQGSEPVSGANIMLMPDPLYPAAPSRFKMAATDQRGSFSMKDVPPGHYRIVALQEAPHFSFGLELGTFEPYAARGTKVSVGEGETARVELTVVKPE